MTKVFHPLLALIASATDKELAKYVQFLKEENKILRSRVDGQIHTKPEERERLLDLGKELGRAIEDHDRFTEDVLPLDRDMYVLVWLCVSSREVIVSTSTEHPNSAWVTEQAERFISETEGREHSPALVMHDRDTKFTREFTAALARQGVGTNSLPKASPNLKIQVA